MRTINYYRVSTAKQGKSGLGEAAQRAAIEAFCATRGCKTLAEYTEIESGKRNDRPKLMEAMHHAKITGATLVVAKLDRLSRDAAFTLALRNSGVPFVCADNPDVNSLTIGVLAVINQDERERISERTKAALAAAKAKGVRLGNPTGSAAFGDSSESGRVAGRAAVKANADAAANDLRPVLEAILGAGTTTLDGIAGELDQRGIQTRRGGKWRANSVANLLRRLELRPL